MSTNGTAIPFLGGHAPTEVIGKRNCDICGVEYEPLTITYKSGYTSEYPWGNYIRIDHADDLKKGKYMYKYRTCPVCSRKVINFINTMLRGKTDECL